MSFWRSELIKLLGQFKTVDKLFHYLTPGDIRDYLDPSWPARPKFYGTRGTAVRVEPCVTTSGQPNVQCVNANWRRSDKGKVFFLHRGGPVGTDTRAMHLVATIDQVVSSTHIRLSVNVEQTLTTARAAYGHDDTEALQECLADANADRRIILTEPGAKYLITDPIGTLQTSLISGDNDSWMYAAYDDNDVVDGSESIFYVESDNVLVEGMCFEWFGYFKKSYISAINHQTGNDGRYLNVKATGFSNAGIAYGNAIGGGADSAITSRGLIQGCRLYGNRRAGFHLGDATDTKIIGNWFLENGLLGDGGAGYGCAAISSGLAYNTLVEGNHAHDNHRRGLDFHAGVGIKIIGNFCLRNKIAGIYAEDQTITGDVIIDGNTVREMVWNGTIASGVAGEGSAPNMFGIHVGAQNGQGLAAEPTNVIITNNIIDDFTQTADGCYGIFAHAGGWSFGSLKVHGNTVRIGDCIALLRTSPNTTGDVGNYFDVDVQGNTFIADECTGLPLYIQGATNRKKIFNDNTVIIGTAGQTAGVLTYDTTVIAGKSYQVKDNTVNAPTSAWSSGYDWCMVKRVADEMMCNNIVNNVQARDWDGALFTDRRSAMPADGLFWTAKSYVENSAAPGPAVPLGWTRLTSAAAADVLNTDWRAEYSVSYGSYTPTLTNVTNIDASTAFICYWTRTGNIVTVSGTVNIDPTAAAGAATHLGISLPIASNFGASTDASGMCATLSAQRSGSCDADNANDRIRLRFASEVTANTTFTFKFSYTII